MKQHLNVCISPFLLPLFPVEKCIVVVIDIFRATSSICYGLANGAHAIIPVAEIANCIAFDKKGYLLAAERDGKVVEGFDFGNSPYSYTSDRVAEKTIVLTTTNGTKAIQSSLHAQKIVIGSFLNLTVLSNWLGKQKEDILLVCAGWKDHFNLEDTVFAGALIDRLRQPGSLLNDAAMAAESLFLQTKDDLFSSLSVSEHGKRMISLHLEDDINFCLQTDLVNVIPVLEGDRLVVMKASL